MLALRRSWFLRIFFFLGLVILFLVNLFTLTDVQFSPEWSLVALPAAIPYRNLLIINLGQSVVAVFLAADFLKRDKKLDTAEVVYTKPVSNFQYVFGKARANLLIFLFIDILLLAIILILNLVSGPASLDLLSYGEYLLLIVVPSLFFILGLSFLVMSLVRNQAVTFLIVLGYAALTFFYLKDRYYDLFDFMAQTLPMLKSDIIGFDRPERFLYQRGMFFLLGSSFFFFSVVLLRRLPRSSRERVVNIFLGLLTLAGGLWMGSRHVMITRAENTLRQQVLILNDSLAGMPVVTVLDHAIRFEHHGRQIALSSRMTVKNENDTVVEDMLFHLNPGLQVGAVVSGGNALPWRRELHLLHVTPPHPLVPGDTLTLQIDYAGTVDDRICYPDIDTFRLPRKLGELLIPSSFGYVMPHYVLLTPELLWYPSPGTTYSPRHPEWYREEFIRFRLHVKSTDSLTVLSQGVASREDDGVTFVPETPLTQISLSIGDYVMRSLTVDSIGKENDSLLCRVYTLRGHDYYVGSMPELDNDTLRILLRNWFTTYENNIRMHYPFSTLSLVEVPVQFHAYQHLWTGAMENVQPEIIYMPEKGATINRAGFAGNWKNYKRWSKWSRETHTDKEYMAETFRQFLDVFSSETGQLDFRQKAGGGGEITSTPNPVNIFPEYFNYRIFLRSEKWPVVNRITESYLKEPIVGTGPAWMRRYSGLSEDEKANIALQEQSFHDLLTDRSQFRIIDNVIKLKGEELFLAVKSHMEEQEQFDTLLYDWLDHNYFRVVSFDSFAGKLAQVARFPLDRYIENWYYGTQLPGFLLADLNTYNAIVDDRTQQLVTITISNPEEGEGVVKMEFFTNNGPVTHVVWLDAHQTKQLHYLFDNHPGMKLNTLISKNIPMVVDVSLPHAPQTLKDVSFLGERIIPASRFHYIPEGTLLVDNEDPGFSIVEPGTEGLFYKILVKSKKTGEKYAGFSWWRPINWTLTTSDAFYGRYVRSAWFVRSGKGERKAIWRVYVPEAGYYTVYYYLDYRKYPWGKDRRNSSYDFTPRHGKVTDEVSLRLRHSDRGWNSLGFYHFPADTAVLELSNKSNYRIVVADAVKLVRE